MLAPRPYGPALARASGTVPERLGEAPKAGLSVPTAGGSLIVTSEPWEEWWRNQAVESSGGT
jgi:hypothetical protein